MKNILMSILLFLSFTTHADYFGASYGSSSLNYDLRGDAYEWLLNDGKEYSSAINLLGGNINVNDVHKNSMNKFYYGHRINQYVGLELFYVQINSFSINANANVDTHIGSGSSVAYGSASGEYSASLNLKGFGLKVFGEYPITNSFSVFGNVGVLRGKSIVKTRVKYDLNYGYDVTTNYGDSHDRVNGYKYESKNEDLHNLVPVFGVGTIYYITENISIKSEFERYGHPIDKLSIDVISVGLQYEY